MVNEELKLFKDTLQDQRYDVMIQTKYHTLVDFILNNTQLNWNKTSLTYKIEESLYTLIASLEPEKYFSRIQVLKDIEKDEKEDILKKVIEQK